MSAPAAWFCPSCQKHHAPHCDTCPGGTGGMEFIHPNYWRQPPVYVVPTYTTPAPFQQPWSWEHWYTTCGQPYAIGSALQ